MNTKDKVHYNQIDALKGIAIFLVILGHGIIRYPIDLHQNTICDFIFKFLSSVHMPLFFMISGFCFSYKGNYKEYIWKKTRRILIPYFVFNMIDVIPRTLLSSLVNRPRRPRESLERIFFYGGEYWFLYVLFLIFLIYPIIYKLIHKKRYAWIGVLCIILILYYVMPIIEILCIHRLIYYLLFFSLGVVTKKHFGKKIFRKKIPKITALGIIVLLLAIWVELIRVSSSYLTIIVALVGILTLFICMQYDELVWLFKRFGKYSLQLYLLNGFLLVISRTIIVLILKVTNPFIIVSFNMIIDFALSYILIKYICEKNKLIKFVMGMIY